jgi:hypothetical protein
MNGQIVAAWISAAFAVLVGGIAALVAVSIHRREQVAQIIIAALEHMGGKTQERSAGLAALDVMTHRAKRRAIALRRVWKVYSPAVGRQLFRQLTYVLNYGENRCKDHEIENLIVMFGWLLDDNRFQFDALEERSRLRDSLEKYVKQLESLNPTTPASTAFVDASQNWIAHLPQSKSGSTHGPVVG